MERNILVEVTAAGVPGKSAYEFAREAGFLGTEEEFAQALNQAAGEPSLVRAETAAAFPSSGQSGTLYLETSSSQLYSWGGSAYQPVLTPLSEIYWDCGGAKSN